MDWQENYLVSSFVIGMMMHRDSDAHTAIIW